MNLLGLDLGSRLTGWACGNGAQLPEVGAWSFSAPDGEYGALLAQLEDHLQACWLRFDFRAVVYEAPILNTHGRADRQFTDSLSKLRKLYPLGPFLEWWCLRRDIPCYEATVGQLKKELTGKGRGDKSAMLAVARRIGLDLPAASKGADDAADAFAAWLLLLRRYDRTAAERFDKLIWSPQSSLI